MKTFLFLLLLVVSPLLLRAANLDPLLHEAYFKASNTEPGDRFGYSVAVSGDIAVVGAPYEDSNATGINGNETDNSAPDAGAAYVFVRNGGAWTLEAYLKASNTDAGDYFGWSVAISGNTIVVGAWKEDSVPGNALDNSASDSGAAYVFVRTDGLWSQQAVLKASNCEAEDWFGWSVSISGDSILVGAYGEDSRAVDVNGNESDDVPGASSGAAYVFTRSGVTWSQQAYLKASNTGYQDRFGTAVSISGDAAVVGAPWEDCNTRGVNGPQNNDFSNDSGAAYVFKRDSGTWAPHAYLKASNTDAFHSPAADNFGVSVCVDAGTIVIGAYRENSSSRFINAGQEDEGGQDSGAAYVFGRSGSQWVQEAYLKAPNTDAMDWFGFSVAVVNDCVVVGAPTEDGAATHTGGNMTDNSSSSSGAVYLYGRLGSGWSFRRYIKASTNGAYDQFGWSVAISPDSLLVGTYLEDSDARHVDGDQTNNDAENAGAAHLFSATPDMVVSVVKSGQAVPDGSAGVVASIGTASLNDNGAVTLDATLSGAGTTLGRNRVICSSLSGPTDVVLRSQADLSGLGAGFTGTKASALASPLMENATYGLFQATITGTGVTTANNKVLIRDDGSTLLPLVRTGQPEGLLANARIASIKQVLQHAGINELALCYTLKTETAAGVTARNDSGLLFLDHAGTRLGVPANHREGAAGFGTGTFGQFFGRAALTPSGDAHFGAYFYFDDTITYGGRPAQALFFSSADNLSHWRTVIQGQIPGETWGVMFQSFLGETSSGSDLLVRATLTGRGATAATNEGIWRGFGGEMWLRKGSDIGGGLFVKRILQFWPVSTDQMVVLAQIGGPGVTLASNTALLLRQVNGQYLTLMRTGTAAQGVTAPGLVAAIQRVDVDAGSGHYAVQASLKGVTAATNQALWMGNTQVGDDGVNQVHRLPGLVVRKGDTYSTAATNNGTILGLDMKTATNPGGAGSRGQLQTIGGGRVVLILLTNGSKKELVIIDRMADSQ